jgi:hypothetical protein
VEQEVGIRQAVLLDQIANRRPGLVGDLEAHWPPGFLLHNGSPVLDRSSDGHVLRLKSNEVIPSKLAIDPEIEEGEFTNLPRHLEPNANDHDLLHLEGWLLPIKFLCLASAMTFLVASTSAFNLAIGGLLSGACVGFVLPSLATALQQRLPKHLRADIQAISGALIFAGAPVAMVGLGLLSEALRPGDFWSIVTGGFVVLATCGLVAVPGNGRRTDQTASK